MEEMKTITQNLNIGDN